MSTFSEALFNTARYASFRPTYPRTLFETVYKYHAESAAAKWNRAVDLGCGTGQASVALCERFESVVGTDPSAAMLKNAQRDAHKGLGFVQSNAEQLTFLEDESVDLITAAQAVHWFKHDQLWLELKRVLRKRGTAAFWNYSEFRLTDHPRLTRNIAAYASDPEQNLGGWWEQPGRGILEDHLQAIKFPTDPAWDPASCRRIYFVGTQYPTAPDDGSNGPISNSPIKLGPNDQHRDIIMRATLDWDDLESYLRTWSSLLRFHNAHPEDKTNPEGDIVRRFVKKLKEGVQEDLGAESKQLDKFMLDNAFLRYPFHRLLVDDL